MKPLFLTALLLLLAACSSANGDAVQTAAAELVTAAAVQTGTAEAQVTAAAVQTSTAEAQADATRRAELDSAVATAVVETAAAESVQTAVVATQEAAFTSTPQPRQLTCAEQASDFLSPLGGILGRWQDAIEIANSTARVSLDGPVANLQAIRREVDELEAPSCASQAKSALISSMDHVIEGFLTFMQDPDDDRISDEFADAAAAMDDFSTIVQGISAAATRESAGD